MPRLMSCSLTANAVVERRKTVTRRLGWRFLKAGDRLTLCRKVMGRRKGEPLERLAEVEVVDVRREQLWHITDDDIAREAVDPAVFTEVYTDTGQPTPLAWVDWFCEEMDVMPDDEVTRSGGISMPDRAGSPTTREDTTMAEFVAGDRVYVIDEGLAQLRAIFAKHNGGVEVPNHHGTVAEDQDDYRREGMVLINFDDGGGAPYPINEVRHCLHEVTDG